jgi:hypothetical protein
MSPLPRLLRRYAPALLALAVALASTGCGDDPNRQKTYKVRGHVVYKGQPASGALAIFHPKTDDSMKAVRPTATVREDGSFDLTTYKDGDGAPEGEYHVLVQWLEDRAPVGLSRPLKQGLAADFLKGRYNNRNKPQFSATVRPEKNELAPLELKD